MRKGARKLPGWLSRSRTLAQILALLLVAWACPGAGAAMQAALPLKSAAIMLIFVLTGLGLDSRHVLDQVRNVRLHVLAQGLCFVVFPVIVWLTHAPFAPLLDGQLALGLCALACVPTTISSCVVFTGMARGNTAAALFNAVFGNVVGIVVSPVVFLALARAGDVELRLDAAAIVWKLSRLVLLPVVAGQLLRLNGSVSAWATARTRTLSRVSFGAILLIVYVAFCSLLRDRAPPVGAALLAALLAYVAALNAVMVGAAVGVAKLCRLTRNDRVTLVFVGSQKTLAMGLPLVMAFAGGNADVSADVMALPIIFYHPVQLIAASFFADRL